MVPRALTVRCRPAGRRRDDRHARRGHPPPAGGRRPWAPIGIVTATDLMYLESRTPFALRRSIAHATDTVDEVIEAARHLPQTVVALIRAGSARSTWAACWRWPADTATIRLIDLAFAEQRRGAGGLGVDGARHRRPPRGSRWPPTRTTRSPTPTAARGDAYFAAVAARVNAGLAACGFGADNAEVLARNRQWRMSAADWRAGLRGLPRAARPLAPDPRRGRVRLPPRRRRRCDIVRAAGRDRAPALRRTPTSSAGSPAPRPTSRRRWASAATASRPTTDGAFDIKKQRRRPDRQPGPVPRPLGRRDRLAHARPAGDRRRGGRARASGPAPTLAEAFELVHADAARAPGGAGRARARRRTTGSRPAALPPLTRASSCSACRSCRRAERLARFVPLGHLADRIRSRGNPLLRPGRPASLARNVFP